MQQLRFAAVCFVIYALALLVGNLAYMHATGVRSQFATLRLLMTIVIVFGLWIGARWARWLGLLFAAYLTALGWLGLITGLASHLYEHQPYPAWQAIGNVLVGAIAVSVAFVALLRPIR